MSSEIKGWVFSDTNAEDILRTAALRDGQVFRRTHCSDVLSDLHPALRPGGTLKVKSDREPRWMISDPEVSLGANRDKTSVSKVKRRDDSPLRAGVGSVETYECVGSDGSWPSIKQQYNHYLHPVTHNNLQI